MTFPTALAICLIFMVGIVTGVYGFYLYLNITTRNPQVRRWLLRLARDGWVNEWTDVNLEKSVFSGSYDKGPFES